MVCVMQNTHLSICPIAHSSPCRERACAGFWGVGWLFLRVVPCVSFLFFFSVASLITYLFALLFPYREGVEGAFVFLFFRNILAIPCVASRFHLLQRERVHVCGWGGVGFHSMLLLVLVSVFLYFAALCTFVYACVVRPFGALFRILNILVRHTIVSPWFVAIPYS